MKLFNKFINESIEPSEATTSYDSIMTIGEGKRKVAFITSKLKDVEDLIKNLGLSVIEVEKNKNGAWIVFSPFAKKEAEDLLKIANSYGGILAHNAKEEDIREIGRLLGYTKESVEKYIKKKKNKIMETKFNDFLNEYGGPYRTAGFRYSEPKNEYTFSVIVLVNPELSIPKLTRDIKQILKDNKVEEDNFNFMKEKGDQYELRINMTAYSNLELIAASDVILNSLSELYPDDIKIIFETVDVEGSDIDIPRRPIGFKK